MARRRGTAKRKPPSRESRGEPVPVARASRPLWRGHPARARERDAPATAGETPALRCLACGLPGHLLDLDDDELSRLEWSKAHHDIDDAVVDVGLGGGLAIALHKVGIRWCLSLEETLQEKVLHK